MGTRFPTDRLPRMMTTGRTISNQIHSTLVAAVAAIGFGLLAATRLEPDSRRVAILVAAAVTLLCVAFLSPATGRRRRIEVAAIAAASACALGAGIEAFDISARWVVCLLWITAIGAMVAAGSSRSARALVPSGAIVLLLVVLVDGLVAAEPPPAAVQVSSAFAAVVALGFSIALWLDHLRTNGAPFFLAVAAAGASVSSLDASPGWTVLFLVGLTGAIIALATTDDSNSTLGSNVPIADRSISAWWAASLVTGIALLIAASAISSEPSWPIVGAVAGGIAALGAVLFQAVEANRAHLDQLGRAAAQSRIDELTGLTNRRGIEERLDEEIARARRFGHPLSLLLIDVDDFKQINDRFGHQQGDLALQRIARSIEGNIRSIDTAARYGGEEFLVLMPETAIAGAAVVAERIRSRIDAAATATVSIGAAELEDPASAARLIEYADGALYRAKFGGKNRVELAAS